MSTDIINLKRIKHREAVKRYNLKNKEKIKNNQKNYYQKNKDKICERTKKWVDNNKEYVYEKHKEYVINHKNELKEYAKNWRVANIDKVKESQKNWYEKNKEIISKKSKDKLKNNPDEVREYKRKCYANNREHYKEYFRKYFRGKYNVYFVKYNLNKKQKVISHYSHGTMKCALCNENRIYALVIDHIDGGGCEHLKNVGNIYTWLIKNNYPDGYQVLCQNHNKEKARINNEYNRKKLVSERVQKNRDDLKWRVFSEYSKSLIPYCKVCNETNLDFLELDHTAGDGFKDIMPSGYRYAGINLYKKLERDKYPNSDKYQVLCCNCNLVKKTENKECGRPLIIN